VGEKKIFLKKKKKKKNFVTKSVENSFFDFLWE